MEIITRTAGVLQGLLSTTAEEVGKACGLIKRKREFTASSLLSTFVLGFLHRARPKWEELALIARQLGANVTPQAVEQRVTPELRDSLERLWQEAVKCVLTAEARTIPLLMKFTQVLIGDSSTIGLADSLADQFPGCGGSHGSGRAAIKLQVIWDCVAGGLRMLWEVGKQNDSTSSVMQEIPPAGSLSIKDLGYFSLGRFRVWQAAGAHWISRGISDLLLWSEGQCHDLHDWLNLQPAGPVDRWVEVGNTRLRCRLVALRAPQEVADRRRQKAYDKAAKKGRKPSARHLANCDWTVFLTSCADDLLTWKEVVVLYRLRWQIELLFKLWKSHNLLEEHRSNEPVRQMAEFYAKLTAVIVQHWLLLTTVWQDERVSLTKAARLIRDHLPQLIAAIAVIDDLIATLQRWRASLRHLARIAQRKKNPSNPQLLTSADILTFST